MVGVWQREVRGGVMEVKRKEGEVDHHRTTKNEGVDWPIGVQDYDECLHEAGVFSTNVRILKLLVLILAI